MRIISTFKDYYDTISLSDYSSELVFHRESQLIVDKQNTCLSALKDKFSFILRGWDTRDAFGNTDPFVVFIHNKAYLGLIKQTTSFNYASSVAESKRAEVYYTYEDAVNAIEKSVPANRFDPKKLQKLFEQFPMDCDLLTQHDIHLAMLTTADISQQLNLDNTLQMMFSNTTKSLRYCNLHNMALWVNPKLDAIDFQKVIDPYTMAQEVEMFIANRANPENNTVQISNKDRIVQHGFDLKQSFRKRKA